MLKAEEMEMKKPLGVRSESCALTEKLLILTISLCEEAKLENIDEMLFLIQARSELLDELSLLEMDEDTSYLLTQVIHQEERFVEILQQSEKNFMNQLTHNTHIRRGIQSYLMS